MSQYCLPPSMATQAVRHWSTRTANTCGSSFVRKISCASEELTSGRTLTCTDRGLAHVTYAIFDGKKEAQLGHEQ